MVETEIGANSDVLPALEEIQQGWHKLTLRVGQLEAEKGALEQENKALRLLLERVIEHRQRSHSELVLLLTTLVSKLPINDVGAVVSRLVEHNTHVSQSLAAFSKGTIDVPMSQPTLLQTLDQAKRDLAAALKRAVEELLKLDPPLENGTLHSLIAQPDLFFSHRMVRASRCFIKGHVPRERLVRECGEEALALFNDVTTDPKLNPHPKRDEIVLAFKSDFELLLQQNASLSPVKREQLLALYQQVQRSKAPTEAARAQRNAFLRLSFVIELLHYYEHQNTEPADVVFAQHLPALVEQLVLTGSQEHLDEKLIAQAEELMRFVISPDHRLMIINNVGKSGGPAKTLKFVLRLRVEQVPPSELDMLLPEFLKHLIPSGRSPAADKIVPILRLVKPAMQRLVTKAIMSSDRLRKDQAEVFGKVIGNALGLQGIAEEAKADHAVPPELERQRAWAKIKDLIARRSDAGTIANAIRERLNARYDAEEIRESWITLTEADPMSLIRIFCHLPYLASGKTDPIARPVMETYITRLTHEKYAATYLKVVNSLRNMFKAKPDSPTLLNFVALVRWVSPEAADKLSTDIGMPLAAS
jgi:hypothetical protein